MNIKYVRYAAGAALFLVLSVSFANHVDSQTSRSIDAPQAGGVARTKPYSEVIGTLSAVLRPTRISVASAKIDAEIIDVGVTKNNNLDVPPNYAQAGWYRYGTLPGERGNAVIDAHVDNGGSTPGPFKNLKKVKPGDEIAIRMSDGRVVVYTVTESVAVPTNKFPKEYVFHGGDQAVLKLITCHGRFVPKLGTYDQRLIVTAVMKKSA